MKDLKVCFIAPTAYQLFNPDVKSSFGGAEIQLSIFARELAKQKNIEVSFIVADYGQEDIEEHDGVRVWKSFNFKKSIFINMICFFKVFKKIDAVIYIQRALTIFSGIIGLYCKFKKKKFIYMVANDGEADRTHGVYNNYFTGVLAGLTFRFATNVVAQNNYQKKKLRSYHVDSIIIKSGWPIIESNVVKKDYVLWVGRLDKDYKRADIFIKLAQDLPDKSFVMIGPCAENQNDYFNKIKHSAENINNLEFISFVEFNEINRYYSEAKVFINTSVQEGFPNTFIQAAVNRTPIISLKVNPSNFITEYNCGYVCEDSYEKMKEKINVLYSSSELYDALSDNAYKYAKENHNASNNSKELLKLMV